jgi:hypothetical protein
MHGVLISFLAFTRFIVGSARMAPLIQAAFKTAASEVEEKDSQIHAPVSSSNQTCCRILYARWTGDVTDAAATIAPQRRIMKSFHVYFLAIAAVILTSGCATGVPYSSMASSIPALKDGEGRVFFFRQASMLGAALSPEIRLNETVVGNSQSGGFFFVDRPAGSYKAATETEVEKTLNFSLSEGEIKYIRSSVSMGVLVGRVGLEVAAPETAKAQLAELSFTGHINRSTVAANAPARTAAGTASAPAAASTTVSATGKVTLDDLRGLLPAK